MAGQSAGTTSLQDLMGHSNTQTLEHIPCASQFLSTLRIHSLNYLNNPKRSIPFLHSTKREVFSTLQRKKVRPREVKATLLKMHWRAGKILSRRVTQSDVPLELALSAGSGLK